MNRKKSGRIVRTLDGRTGRTFNDKGMVNGKIPVFITTKEIDSKGMLVPVEFSKEGTLFSPYELTTIGMID